MLAAIGDPRGVLVVDATGFVKKGRTSAGVQRQYTGTSGKIGNCQIGVFLAYASVAGRALPIRPWWTPGRGHWLLARRSITDPTKIAYYICYAPRRTTLATLTWVAGRRWPVEECFKQAKQETGLDHYQVRTWRGWYATSPIDARPGLARRSPRRRTPKRGTSTNRDQLIAITVPEARRLIGALLNSRHPDNDHTIAWSLFRRRRRWQAQQCHWQRRTQVPLQY